jgi:type II secretory pathway pseudopilin PulG
MRKKENGITLIALVVTIVVLIIIAGISIGSITSDNRNYKRNK